MPSSASRHRLLVASLVATVAALLWAAIAATPARAGAYTIHQCRFPDGTPAPMSAGWYGYGEIVAVHNFCGSGGDFGIYTRSSIEPDTEGGVGVSVPAERPNIEISQVTASMDSGNGPWGGSRYFIRQFAGGQMLDDGAYAPFSRTTTVRTPLVRGYLFDLFCSTSAGTYCYTGDGAHAFRLWAVALTLREGADPGADATGGTLLSPGARRGTASLNYIATDQDSGVRSVAVRLGATQVAADDLASRCTYADWNACPTRFEHNGIDVDLRQLPDGDYPLRFAVADAAGNERLVDTGRIVTVQNAPPPAPPAPEPSPEQRSASASGGPASGSAAPAAPVSTTADGGRGGSDDSPRPRASATLRARPRRIRNGGIVTLTGRLLGEPFPVPGVLVTLQGRLRPGGGWRTFGLTRTHADGRFRYRYRFTRVRRRTQRFQFRARIARQPGYPYEAGTSRRATALVRS